MAANQSLGSEAFLARARGAHGDKYDYSLTAYKRSHSKVKITCPIHGLFEQTPKEHMNGGGCRKCGAEHRGARARGKLADFLARARETHGDRYNYSQAVYTISKAKIKIICPEHGVFEQIAANHINGLGCPICGKLKMAANQSLGSEAFLARARGAHGDKYDYSQARYAARREKVKIICPKHGMFEQRAATHLKGFGCPCCGRERTTAIVRLQWIEQAAGMPCILYFLRIYKAKEQFYKVGITSRTVRRRYGVKSTLNGYQYEVLALHQSGAARVWDWEQSILETFTHLSYKPKKHFGGAGECFSSCEEILSIFPL